MLNTPLSVVPKYAGTFKRDRSAPLVFFTSQMNLKLKLFVIPVLLSATTHKLSLLDGWNVPLT
jgi:hypothetical protein